MGKELSPIRFPLAVILVAAALYVVPALTAEPPPLLNYQGVLRDASDTPLDGAYHMIFRFWDSETGGNELLIDEHPTGGGSEVAIDSGLFSVALGSGDIFDGSGPGTYTSLAEVFRDYATIWLEVEVHPEVLSPRIRIVAAAYAMNADHLDGNDGSYYLDTSSTNQTKSGALSVDATGGPAVRGFSPTGGGYFEDTDGSAYANVGFDVYGIDARGDVAGGYFANSLGTSHAYIGYYEVGLGDYGVQAYGGSAGGVFQHAHSQNRAVIGSSSEGIKSFGDLAGGTFLNLNTSSHASIGTNLSGIEATGEETGGHFVSFAHSGNTYVASGDYGIDAMGTAAGGMFWDLDGSGFAKVAVGDFGIDAYGNEAGGYFRDANHTGYAYVATGDRGIEGHGDDAGGYFSDLDSSGAAWVAYGDYGIEAHGTSAGAHFTDYDNSGSAYVGYGDFGIEAQGSLAGAHFRDTNESGYAYVGNGDFGIKARGNAAGALFEDLDSSGSAYVGYGSYKIQGTGSVAFVQNHPLDHGKVIVYNSPEGDEVATYTRGTARLADGTAVVALGETFRWVTNPAIGLTAHVTPRGLWADLYVESVSTDELVVRSRDGTTPDAAFDYIVYGLRIGFEESAPVQPKREEAYIPSMKSHREFYAEDEGLRRFNSLERFKAMAEEALAGSFELDLSAANELRAAIQEYNPQIHGPIGERPDRETEAPENAVRPEDLRSAEPVGAEDGSPNRRQSNAIIEAPAGEPMGDSPAGAPLFPVSEPVEPGDLLVLDTENPGKLRRAAWAADPAVIGIVAREASDLDGTLQAPVVGTGFTIVKVDASYGAVRAGDRLTSSPTPGHAMRALDPVPGTIIGKAMESLEYGTGLISVLVNIR